MSFVIRHGRCCPLLMRLMLALYTANVHEKSTVNLTSNAVSVELLQCNTMLFASTSAFELRTLKSKLPCHFARTRYVMMRMKFDAV